MSVKKYLIIKILTFILCLVVRSGFSETITIYNFWEDFDKSGVRVINGTDWGGLNSYSMRFSFSPRQLKTVCHPMSDFAQFYQ